MKIKTIQINLIIKFLDLLFFYHLFKDNPIKY